MTGSTTARDLAALQDVLERATDEATLFEHTAERLRRLVPFDGSAWFGTDPATVLATCPVRIENVAPGHCETYWEREAKVEDALLFRDLARSDAGVGTLYRTTGEHPDRSTRYREFLAPQGYGDELRAAVRAGGPEASTWAVFDLFRERGRPAFTAAEVSLVGAVLPALAMALRALAGGGRVTAGAEGPGTILCDRDGTILSLDETAERLLEELAGAAWATLPLPMTPIYAAAARAVAIAEGRDRGQAAVRLRALSGRWLAVHASALRGRDGRPGLTAVTIEPAKSAQIAPIIVEAYRLTPREQEITRSVARGLSTAEIAAELFLSPHTVRDHLKAIFGKVGVTSRGELVAKLFAEHYMPAMHAPGAAVHAEV